MQIKTKAIVFSTLKYQEKSLIVKCFTLSNGIVSYFVPNAFSAKKHLQKIAYFQPLNILEIDVNHKNKGGLEYFKEIKLSYNYNTISTNIYKSTIAIFLSEILNNIIKEEEKNENFFIYLEAALMWLDQHDKISNFHLILLLDITKFLGFYPDTSSSSNNYFEMTEGGFITNESVSCLTKQESELFKRLINLKFDSIIKAFSQQERQQLLTIILNYYSIHLEGFKTPKSLEVLKEVFS